MKNVKRSEQAYKEGGWLMARKAVSQVELVPLPMLAHETLYVGVDIGKKAHVAGFLSTTLLTRHQRFEHCPALTFENSRDGFRSLLDRISTYVPLTQVQAVLARDRALPPSVAPVPTRSRHPGLRDACPEATRGIAQIRQTRCPRFGERALQPT